MTARYAVFGNPIAHSLSPLIHSCFARLTHDDISYERILVEPGQFRATADEFFKTGSGCNVTVPCKLDAYGYADSLTARAEAAGAVNTLKKLDDGSILGDNTDGGGFQADLTGRLGCALSGQKVLLIGAGGAAKGILRVLLEAASVVIANRTPEKAQALCQACGSPENCSVRLFSELEGGFDLIVNASSSSLYQVLPEIKDEVYSGCTLAYDLYYTPRGTTVFTEQALKCGAAKAVDGFGMLIGQGILSYELWRGLRPDMAAAMEYLRTRLKD